MKVTTFEQMFKLSRIYLDMRLDMRLKLSNKEQVYVSDLITLLFLDLQVK